MDGYRSFDLGWGDDEPFLRPTATIAGHVALEFPLVEAICTTGGYGANGSWGFKHRAPVESCTCGYYAYLEPPGALHYGLTSGNVMAKCWGSGRCVVHSHGFRSRRIAPMAFYWPICGWTRDVMGRKYACGNAVDFFAILPSENWPHPTEMFCTEHSVQAAGVLVAAEAVLFGLGKKFTAGVIDRTETVRLLNQWPEWNKRMQEEISAIGAAAREDSELRRRERERRDAIREAARNSQLPMLG